MGTWMRRTAAPCQPSWPREWPSANTCSFSTHRHSSGRQVFSSFRFELEHSCSPLSTQCQTSSHFQPTRPFAVSRISRDLSVFIIVALPCQPALACACCPCRSPSGRTSCFRSARLPSTCVSLPFGLPALASLLSLSEKPCPSFLFLSPQLFYPSLFPAKDSAGPPIAASLGSSFRRSRPCVQ